MLFLSSYRHDADRKFSEALLDHQEYVLCIEDTEKAIRMLRHGDSQTRSLYVLTNSSPILTNLPDSYIYVIYF
jgi:hypothetical protein